MKILEQNKIKQKTANVLQSSVLVLVKIIVFNKKWNLREPQNCKKKWDTDNLSLSTLNTKHFT